jgi:hypothetical protein
MAQRWGSDRTAQLKAHQQVTARRRSVRHSLTYGIRWGESPNPKNEFRNFKSAPTP